jgi:hypothetical protein
MSPTEIAPARLDDEPGAGWGRFATLPDWLTAIIQPERVQAALVRAVPEFATGTRRLQHCAVHRVRLKQEQWTALYQLTVAGPADDTGREVALRGTLFPPGIAPPAARDQQVAFGSAGWQVYLPELRLALEPQPPDAALPALPVLTDPEQARALLEQGIRQGAPATYHDFRLAAAQPRVMRYSPGSRCTILYHLAYPADRRTADHWPDIVVAKTYHRDKGRQAYEAMRALWDSPLATGDVVAIAEPLAFLPEWNVLVQGPVREEQTLQDLIRAALRTGTPEVPAALDENLRKAAAGLAALHDAPVQPRDTRVWADELAEVRQVNDRLSAVIPALAGALAPLLTCLEAQSAAIPADPAVPAHGTFRPAQVLLHQGRIGFIDFDSFCRAEPALDVALFIEKVKDLGLSADPGDADDADDIPLDPAARPARLAQVEAFCATFLDAYRAQRPISAQRIALWETLYLLTLVLHCWTKVKPARLVHSMFLLEHHLRTNPFLTEGTADG